MLFKRMIALIFVSLIANPIAVLPIAAPTRTASMSHAVVMARTHPPVIAAFNLGSTNTSFSASSLVGNKSLSIMIGKTMHIISAVDELTPAEFIATYQVATQGRQTLQINGAGNAVGGSIKLDSVLDNMLTSLTIPKGVTVIDDVAGANILDLSGNLINSGTLYAFSTNPLVTTASIIGSNIDNLPGGLITTVMPTSLFAHAGISSLDLSLSALGNIVNAGIISSSGNLRLTANGSISNCSAANIPAIYSLITAKNNVFIQATDIVNQGRISALTGDLLATGVQGNSLIVNNSRGQMCAQNNLTFQTLGSIEDNRNPAADLSISGGSLAGNHVYFIAPGGNIAVSVDSIKGGVNLSGDTSAINVSSGTLSIESSQLTGDPIFTDAMGNLDLAGLFTASKTFSTAGGDFVALAGGNIYISMSNGGNSLNIDATSSTGAGGAITMAAGVTFDLTSGYKVTGVSKSGGSINLPQLNLETTNNNIVLTANTGTTNVGDIKSGNLTSGSGGNITIASGNQGTVNFASNVVVQAGNIDIQTGNLVVNGSIVASATNGSINIHSPGALTLTGNPENIAVNSAGTGTITVSASGASALTLSSYTFSAGQNGLLVLSAKDPGGAVVFPDNAILYIYGGVYTSLISPQIKLGQNSGILATGASVVDINSGSLAQSIILPGNSLALLSTNGGYVTIGPYGNANLSFTTATGSTSQLFVNAGNLNTYSNGGNTTVGVGVTLATNQNMQLNLNGGTLFDYGSLLSSAYAGNITVSSQNNNLTLAGAPVAIILSGGGAATVNFTAGGPNSTIFVNASYAVNGDIQGASIINAANVSVAGGQALSAVNGSRLDMYTQTLNLGSNSTISGSQAVGNAVYFGTGGPQLSINITPGGTATIASTQGSDILFSQNALSFSGLGSKLNVTGGTLNAGVMNNVTVGNNVTLVASNNINLSIYGGTGFVDNGTIISNGQNGAINITGGTGLTLSGTPKYIAVEGGGNSAINITGYNNGLSITAPYIFDAGKQGTVSLVAATGYLSLPPQTVIAGGSTLNVSGAEKVRSIYKIVTTNLSAQAYIASISPKLLSTNQNTMDNENIGSAIPSLSNLAGPVSASDMAERVYDWQTTMPMINNSIRDLLGKDKLQKDLQEQPEERGDELLVMNSCCTRKAPDRIQGISDRPIFAPVAFVTQAAAGAMNDLQTTDLAAAMLKYTSDTGVIVNRENHLVLKHGETILVATRPMTMQIGKCTIQLKAITIALVSKDHGVLTLRNLYDKQSHSITFSLPCGKMDVSPGHEVILAVSSEALSRYLVKDPTARRRFDKVILDDGHNVATAEASLVSLLKTSTVLCALRHSNLAEDRAIANKIMLMAACVMISTPGHGRYVVLTYDNPGHK